MLYVRTLICFLFLIFCAPAWAETPPNVLMVGMRLDDLATLDPAEVFEVSGGELVANLYDRLIDMVDGQPKGVLAESWKISADGRQFLFTLKKGMKFHSGKLVTAGDVAWSFERVIKLDRGAAPLLRQLGLTQQNVGLRARAEGDQTFVLDLADPLAPGLVLNILSSYAASVVDSRLGQQFEKNGDFASTWLRMHDGGSGPFKLMLWKPGQGLVLDRFANHHERRPTIERIALRHVAESSVQRLMLEKGDLDIARNLAPDDLERLERNTDVKLLRIPQGGLVYLGMNMKAPPLADPKVRRALKLLIDYDGIARNILKGSKTVHQTILADGFAGALKETPYRQNIEEAKRLLSEAGYGGRLALTLDVRNVSPSLDIASALAADFAKAGVRIDIVQMDNRQLLTRYRARAHMLTLAQWSPDYPDPHATIQGFAWNPDNSDDSPFRLLAWRNGWNIPELTGLVQSAKSERDGPKRAKLYEQVQRTALDGGPYAVMFQDMLVLAHRAGVHNLRPGLTFDSMRYADVTKDGLK
ncbi:MAG: ABC transporter substrate-binding protein [Alphaproteobacteria bacterium]|nr:ABC transporter substrate-binding protein [Alphaproteobacteria bacterium]